jgi:hypothetical protein
MTSRLLIISILLGEYLLLAISLWCIAFLDNRRIHYGGSILSFAALVAGIALARWLTRRHLPGRPGLICFFVSIPLLLYVWMLGFVSAGAGF